MSRKRKQHKIPKTKQKIASVTKKRLVILIAGLAIILAFLIFKPGYDSWPAWLIDSRGAITAILGFATILLILMSPIIVVTESDPRPLSGPGKNPKHGGGY
jgi:hypothetical protein